MKTSLNASLLAILIISINLSAQEYQWGHSFGNTNGEEGLWIDHDEQGNVYATGYFYGTLDFDPSANTANLTEYGNGDIFIASYDPNGNFRWAINPGGSGFELGMSIAVHGNRLYTTGYFLGTADFDPSANTANLTSNGNADAFLACYDTDGNYQWANSIGSTGWDSGSRVKVDPNGNPIATGEFVGTVDFDPSANTANLTEYGSSDIWIAKYNTDGSYNWAINPGGTSYDRGNGITIDGNGNVYVTGRADGTIDADPSANTANLTSNGLGDISLLSYDNDGNYRWGHILGGSMSDVGWSVTHHSNGTDDFIYFTGSFENTVDFDPSANDNILTSSGLTDIFVGCFDVNGNHMGSYNYGGPWGDAGYSIDANNTDDLVWITGEYGGDGNLKIPFGNFSSNEIYGNNDRPTPAFYNNQQYCGDFIFLLAVVVVLATSGWNKPAASSNPMEMSALFPAGWGLGNGVSAHNPVYLIGEYTGSIDLDASDNNANFTSTGSATDFFIAKYSQNSLDIDNTESIPKNFRLEQNYPNPFNPVTIIEYNIPHDSHVTIDIFNINGKLINTIFNGFRRVGNHTINWNGLDSNNNIVSSGTYIYRLRSNGTEITKKMILLR